MFVPQGGSFYVAPPDPIHLTSPATPLSVSCVSCGDSHKNVSRRFLPALAGRACSSGTDGHNEVAALLGRPARAGTGREIASQRASQPAGRRIYLPAHAGSPVVFASSLDFISPPSSKIQPTGCGQTLSNCWIMFIFFLDTGLKIW